MVGLRGPPEVPLPAPTHPVVLVTATGLVIRFNSPCPPEPDVPEGTVSTDGENALFDIGLVPYLWRVLDSNFVTIEAPFLLYSICRYLSSQLSLVLETASVYNWLSGYSSADAVMEPADQSRCPAHPIVHVPEGLAHRIPVRFNPG